MKKMLCLLSLACFSIICLSACGGGTSSNMDEILAFSNNRYDTVAAPTTNNVPNGVGMTTDGTNNYYLINGGYIENVPIVSGAAIAYYQGGTNQTLSISQQTVSEQTVENSLSKAVSESVSTTDMSEVGASITVETGGLEEAVAGKISAELSAKLTSGTVTENGQSTTDTVSTANTVTESLTNGLSCTIGEKNEPTGLYRYSLFSICDVYFLLTTDRNNTTIIDCTAILCARPSSVSHFVLDYDSDINGDFGKTASSQKLADLSNYYRNLPIPTYVDTTSDNPADTKGDGTSENPYKITSAIDFVNMINIGNAQGMYFELTNNIDLASYNSFDAGNWNNVVLSRPFYGNLDGQNYEVQNLVITRPPEALSANVYLGLVGMNYGSIKNIKIVSPSITVGVQHDGSGWIYAGSVCGLNNGTITNVTATNVYIDIMRDKAALGGIAGSTSLITSVIENCNVTLTQIGENGDTGGIIGQLQCGARVENCTVRNGSTVSNGIIFHYSTNNTRSVGGIVGVCDNSSIISCSIGYIDFVIASDDKIPAIGVLCGSLRNGSLTYQCGIINDVSTTWAAYVQTHEKNNSSTSSTKIAKMFKQCGGAIGELVGKNTVN